MTQQTSPFVEAKFGWDFGESNWNTGMDENLLKFSYLHDSNINAIVASLPAPVNGEAYFRTTDRRVHFVVNGSFVSTPIPIWHELTIKSTGKKYTYNGTALTPSKTLSTINVADYGAVGDGVTESLPAFNAAISYAKSIGGARIVIPHGTFKMSGELPINPIGVSGGQRWFNIVLEGAGCNSTILNFSSAPPSTDGIAIYGWGGRLNICHLGVASAPGIGIAVNKGIVRGSSTSWISRIAISDVIVNGCGSDGIKMIQTYMGQFDNIESRNNGGFGFNLDGFHTSLQFNRCWAGGDQVYPNGGNLAAGWRINGTTYSQFICCSSDQNANGPGYTIQNVAGVVFSACGSESNDKEGWLVRTRNTDTTGVPSGVHNINGLLFEGCFSVNNSKESTNLYANLIGVSTQDNRAVRSISINNCVDIDAPAGRPSLVFNSTGTGYIDAGLDNNVLSSFTFKAGDVVLRDAGKVGLSCMVRLVTGIPTSIPNITEAAAPLFQVGTNTLRAVTSSGGVTIPKGVNRVKITAGTDWAENLTGFRNVRIFKTSVGTTAFVGTGQQKTTTNSSFVYQNVSTGIIEVNEGDFFGLAVTQNSGGALDLRSSPNTFMSVEVMG